MNFSIPTLLIVEDDTVLQDLYANQCQRLGLAYVQLYDGVAALDYLDHDLDKVHAIILDYMLPDVDGRVILEKIKTKKPVAPTIVISAIAQTTDELSLLQPGVILEIVKGDIPLHTIIESIHGYLTGTSSVPSSDVTLIS